MKKVVVLDFGNEFNQEWLELMKEEGFETGLMNYDTRVEDLKALDHLGGLILAGSYKTLKEKDSERFDKRILELGLPVLGLGRGMQVIIDALGGTVTPQESLYEPTPCALTFHNLKDGIFKGGDKEREVCIGFDAAVSKLPEGFSILANGHEIATKADRPFGAMENPKRKIYGIQFITHPNKKEDCQAIVNFLNMIQ